MKGIGVGATTLAYLRGEKDLVREREPFAQAKKQLEERDVGIGGVEHKNAGWDEEVERYFHFTIVLSNPYINRFLK